MTQAAVKVLYKKWHNEALISLGDYIYTHNTYLWLLLTHLEAGHLELFPCLKHCGNYKADLLKTTVKAFQKCFRWLSLGTDNLSFKHIFQSTPT